MNKLKFGWKYYFSPTPKRIRVFGDSLASAGVFAGTISALNGHPYLASAVFVAAWIGKVISNFFAEENEEKKEI